ncbi:protein phosphatase 2C domain-containing protein [Halobellus marinus]|uniref:protein phosphatase 2C domain-containing protein n=1 Tax=Halobellus TaxID=1073986 RepID=UPI0028A8053E|nr:protein phosphatase 2C domain-containing protein [Halobellus sp. DFY28]
MYYASRCDLGDRKRKQNDRLPPGEQYVNEDSTAALVFDDIHRSTEREAGVFVVADGAGGEDAGDVASYLATSVISEDLAEYVVTTLTEDPSDADIDIPAEVSPGGDRIDPETAIEEAVQAAQARIVEYAKAAEDENADPNNPFRAYTTVVAGIYDGERLHYGWVGDSRAYVINTAAERISPLTKDHSEVQALEDAGAVNETEALVHPDSHKIRRAVGGTSFSDPENGVEVDTGSVPVYEDDVLLFTSDGLIDAYPDIDPLHRRYQAATGDEKEAVAQEIKETVVTDDDIQKIVLEGDSLDTTAERFIEFSNEKGGKDNLSILLARGETLPPTPDPLPPRGFEEREEEDVTSQETAIIPPEDSDDGEAGSESEAASTAETPPQASANGESAADSEAADASTDDADTMTADEDPEAAASDGEAADSREASGGSAAPAEDAESADSAAAETDGPDTQPDGSASAGQTTEDGATADEAPDESAAQPSEEAAEADDEAGDSAEQEYPTVRLVAASGESYTVTEGDTFGRGSDADVQIEGPNTISRVHARVVLTGDDEWRLADQSSGGTYVEAAGEWKRVKHTRTPPLDSGTLLALGKRHEDCVFEFRL